MKQVHGIEDLRMLERVLGQPNVNLTIDRAKADRFGINVADVQDAIETAVGGKAVSQILKGEERFDLVVRYQEPYRKTIENIANIQILSPSEGLLGRITKEAISKATFKLHIEHSAP